MAPQAAILWDHARLPEFLNKDTPTPIISGYIFTEALLPPEKAIFLMLLLLKN